MGSLRQLNRFGRSVFTQADCSWPLGICAILLLGVAMVLSVLALGKVSAVGYSESAPILFQIQPIDAPSQGVSSPSEEWTNLEVLDYFSKQKTHSWYLLRLDGLSQGAWGEQRLVFESRHLMDIQCSSLAVQFNGHHWVGNAADLAQGPAVCQIKMVGPGDLQLFLADASSLQSVEMIEREQLSFLQGSFLSLILLALLSILATGKPIFLVYAVWLVASLRDCLIAYGLDAHFFGLQIPLEWLPHSRALALLAYFAATFHLTLMLFPQSAQKVWQPLRTVVNVSILVLLGLAVFGSYGLFLQFLWPVATIGSLVIFAVPAHAFFTQRSMAVVFYLLSISAVVFNAVADIMSAWFDFSGAQITNGYTVALFSSWMLVISVIEAQRDASQAKKRAEQDAIDSQKKMSTIFDLAPSPMFSMAQGGQFTAVNNQFRELLDMPDCPDFLKQAHLANLYKRLTGRSRVWTQQYCQLQSFGQNRWYELTLISHNEELIGSVRDITTEKDREAALHYQATHDELTSALNRRGLEDCLMSFQKRGVESVNMALLDVWRFKHLVRAHGLKVADRILLELYELLLRDLGGYGHLVRFGYDQFLVISEKRISGDISTGMLFDGVLDSLHTQALSVDGLQAIIRLQICTMSMPIDPEAKGFLGLVEDLVLEMKLQLCQSDVDYKYFSDEQSQGLIKSARIGEQLLEQVLPENLTLCWQPIMGIQNDKPVLYAEALLRQLDSDGKPQSAWSVVSACQNRGQSTVLDRWTIKRTLEFLTRHSGRLLGLNTVSVNVVPSSLNDESFLQDVLTLLEDMPLAARKLCLEVTEIGMIINPESVKRFMNSIRALGVKVALDDFGAGFSNFQYVLDLQADVIKIDGSIASKVCKSPESRSVVNAVVSLAKDLGCDTVAEWVEDEFTLDELRDLGIDYIQGFLVSQAIDPEEFFARESSAEFYSPPPKKLEGPAGAGDQAVVTGLE